VEGDFINRTKLEGISEGKRKSKEKADGEGRKRRREGKKAKVNRSMMA
jgi:hypothetical protein